MPRGRGSRNGRATSNPVRLYRTHKEVQHVCVSRWRALGGMQQVADQAVATMKSPAPDWPAFAAATAEGQRHPC